MSDGVSTWRHLRNLTGDALNISPWAVASIIGELKQMRLSRDHHLFLSFI
jgi:hypothetical protein